MLDIGLTSPSGWTALGECWRALEARAACSFFQSWSWVGCAQAARYPDPVLLSVQENGETVALGLFNRRARLAGAARLWLNESGQAEMDRIHVEHNGLLVAEGRAAEVVPAALARLLAQGRHLVLSGVDERHLAAARATGGLLRQRSHPAAAPWINLAAVRASEGGHLSLLSANTRQQIRRSLRRYSADAPLRIDRAGSLAEAQDFLAALGVLHQRTWTQRGQPGAFANADFVAFHRDLLDRAWPRGEIDLLRIAAGAEVLGYLYNFRWRGRVANYQSGFDYAAAGSPHRKPGLTSHHLAVEMYAAEGLDAYDMLAGRSRYKTSMATDAETLHWIELLPPASFTGMLHRVRLAMGRD